MKKTRKEKTIAKPYWEVNFEELREVTKEFDEPFVKDRAEPLTPEMKAQWERAKLKRGRPMKGHGAKVISLSVERDLLGRADALAEEQGMTRADLVAKGISAVLAVYSRE
jgi:hypothetical protein